MHSARKKMSRREMKRDPLLVWTSRISMFMRENMWALIAGVVAVVVVVFAVLMYNQMSERKYERGLNAIAQLESMAPSMESDVVIAQANRIISDYGGFPKNAAILCKADALRRAGSYAEARAAYESVRGKFGAKNDVYSFRVIRGYADALSVQGDYSRAANELQSWVNRHSKSGLAPYALLDAATNYELAANYSGARAALQRIVDTFENSQVAGDARRRLRLMEGAVSVTAR